MPAIMVQGCGSDVGKSVLVAGLCRLLRNRGFAVRPFKPQNMSNNAAVTREGGEIGRSTALQALACGVEPSVHMNPVLLKPQSDRTSQLILRGQRVGEFRASEHGQNKGKLLDAVLESFHSLRREADWVVVEGAGSPAETNLRTHDIANMGFAHAADVPVVLVGDIDRGHVIASLVGANTVLSAADRARIHGYLINKFRGDPALFADGLRTVTQHTGWPSFGVIPWLEPVRHLPAEDAVQLQTSSAGTSATSKVRITVMRLPHIANFDDFDPLKHEPNVDLQFIEPSAPLAFDTDLLILPGSKATIADLQVLHAHGWEHDLRAHVRRGGRVLGICAGLQMLGTDVSDPLRIEGSCESIRGFGLLDITTTMTSQKVLRQVNGIELSTGARVAGYEMHVGQLSGAGRDQPMVRLDDGSNDGVMDATRRVMGCHLHGVFSRPEYRSALLAQLGTRSVNDDHRLRVDRSLDEIAAALEQHCDIAAMLALT